MIQPRTLAMVFATILLAGCGGAATPASTAPASPALSPAASAAAAKPSASAPAVSAAASVSAKPAASAAAKPAGEPYKIGVAFPLTGPLAAFGGNILPGVQIATDDINRSGGIQGHPIQLVSEDTKGTPEAGVAAMRKMVEIDKVPVVITIFTNVVTAQLPLADQLKVPIVTTTESPGLMANSPWAFAHAPTYTLTAPLLQAEWKAVGAKRLFAFYPNNAIAELFAPVNKKVAQELGAAYDEARFNLGSTDFRGLLARAKDFNPDAIVINGQCTADEGAIMKQARELGIKAPFYQGSACFTEKSWRDSVGAASEGMVYSGFVLDKNKAQPVIDAYKAKLGYEPSYATIEMYDVVQMIKHAVEENGYNAEGIRKGLISLKDFPSAGGGAITMADDHQSRPTVALYKIQNGAAVAIKPGG